MSSHLDAYCFPLGIERPDQLAINLSLELGAISRAFQEARERARTWEPADCPARGLR